MPDAVIVATARSPIGRAGKGSLVDVRPDDLAATIVRAALDRVPQLDPRDIEDLYVGCGLPGGEQGFNLARVVAVLLGYDHLPGATLTRYCASSLQTTRMAFHAIKAGEGARETPRVPTPSGDVVSLDDGPRPGVTMGAVPGLKPVFRPDGRITAGNCCPLNDGAAAVVVMSDTRARELGITPLARIVASSVAGVAPEIMGVGPIEAVRKVLEQAGMTIDDLDVVELNEAFAAQVLPVCRELGIDPFSDKLNPHGGAIAHGRP